MNILASYFGDYWIDIFGVLVIIPFLALTSRRLRDAGFPGFLVILIFFPLVGTIPLIAFLLFPSEKR